MNSGNTTGWLDSPFFDRHTHGPVHPECPERLAAIREELHRVGVSARLDRREPAEVDRALLERVHVPDYVARIERLCAAGGGPLDPDTSAVPESWPAALRAAGAVVEAVGAVLAGEWRRACCTVRPPGHHALAGRAMGFCLFDNVALGAQAALDSGLSRVAIIDWDVHHGNGTQAIFWRRADVLYASWHQYPFYPGTGAEQERGEGAGLGVTVNCPLPAGAGDREYLDAWEDRIRPALDSFAPELLLISAGFDADARDPLAGLRISAAGFEELSRRVIDWTDGHCDGRVVSVLEGGYALDALAEDMALHVGTML
jgi:acetoin utilization deacetylase AcuC-like enzyme